MTTKSLTSAPTAALALREARAEGRSDHHTPAGWMTTDKRCHRWDEDRTRPQGTEVARNPFPATRRVWGAVATNQTRVPTQAKKKARPATSPLEHDLKPALMHQSR